MTESGSAVDSAAQWDAASCGYAEKVAPLLMESFAETLVERLGDQGASRVLEVGAGSGALTKCLAARVGSLLATDFSKGMIGLLQERISKSGASNVDCAVMDGQALELDDSSFDAAASSFALMLFPDRQKGFEELCRVVRSGGRVVISAWAGPDRFEAFGLFLEAMKGAFPDMPSPPTPPPIFSLANPVDFKSEMEAAGFRDVEIEFVSRDLEIGGFEQAWEMFTVGAPPVQALFSRVGDAGVSRLSDQLRSLIETRYGDGPIRLTNVATVGTGVVG